MRCTKVFALVALLAFVSACAAADPTSFRASDDVEETTTFVDNTGVNEVGGPIGVCVTRVWNDSQKPIHSGCFGYRGTAQGFVEAGTPALIGAGAALGSAGIIRSGMDEIPAAKTNVTVQNSNTASGAKPSYKKQSYGRRSPGHRGWGRARSR